MRLGRLEIVPRGCGASATSVTAPDRETGTASPLFPECLTLVSVSSGAAVERYVVELASQQARRDFFVKTACS